MSENALAHKGELGRYFTRPNPKFTRQFEWARANWNFTPLIMNDNRNIPARIQIIRLGGVFPFLLSTYFTEGRTNLPQEAIGPNGSNCFMKGPEPLNFKKASQLTTCDKILKFVTLKMRLLIDKGASCRTFLCGKICQVFY